MNRYVLVGGSLIDLEDRLGRARDLAAMADDYAVAATGVRRRPMPVPTHIRYPRGRLTDRIPVAAALQPIAG